MRITSFFWSDGVPPWVSHHATVYLDGERMTSVISADDAAGEVTYYPRDHLGRFIKNSSGDSFKTETRRGRVRIEFSALALERIDERIRRGRTRGSTESAIARLEEMRAEVAKRVRG